MLPSSKRSYSSISCPTRHPIGSDIASPEVKAEIGHYDVLGKQAAKMIPGSRLVEFAGKGHAPQMEDTAGFNNALIEELDRR